MMNKQLRLTPEKLIVFLELSLLVILLFWRFQLGVTRYFDVDEYAHLHWGYSVFVGEKPYTDFFYLFPPFFLYPIAAIFAILGRSVTALLGGRIFIFIVFLATTTTLFLLGRKMRSLNLGLLAASLFAFLPLPSDKMIEVRPDLIATLFSLLGLYLFILWQEKEKRRLLFLAGASFSLSLGFVPKTLFFLLPPIVVLGYKFLIDIRRVPAYAGRLASTFLAGLLLPAIALLFLIFSYGNAPLAIYSITSMSANITAALAAKFYMRPDLFFYTNETYYGIGGYSWPYITNLVIYLSASVFAIHRLISCTDGKKCGREFLFGFSFFANLYAFVSVYPLKHAQYLIAVAPFISFYFADLLETVFGKIKFARLRFLGFAFILFCLFLLGKEMYQTKLNWSNKTTLGRIENLLKTIPRQEAIFDLTGESIFFPNGYYFCCLPYGQYEEAIAFNLPSLEKEFNKRKTKYIYTGSLDRLGVLPPWQAKYIRENFVNLWPDGSLLVRK